MDKQYLLLVDSKDNFLGEYKEKEICHTGKGFHHRAFVVCVFNRRGEILLQYRKHKRWDKYWDVAAISHCLHLEDHDESYDEAARRALKAEMGLSPRYLDSIGGFNYFARYGEQCENEYCSVLVTDWSRKVFPNMDVMYKYKWMGKEEFIKDCKDNPDIYAPWTILTAELLGRPAGKYSR